MKPKLKFFAAQAEWRAWLESVDETSYRIRFAPRMIPER
jgi:hypothetical protein